MLHCLSNSSETEKNMTELDVNWRDIALLSTQFTQIASKGSPFFPLCDGRVLTKCSNLEGELITALSCRCNNSQLAYKTSCLFYVKQQFSCPFSKEDVVAYFSFETPKTCSVGIWLPPLKSRNERCFGELSDNSSQIDDLCGWNMGSFRALRGLSTG